MLSNNVIQLRVEGHMAPPTAACIDVTGQRMSSTWRRPLESSVTEVIRVISASRFFIDMCVK
jgi:hypothetical protein